MRKLKKPKAKSSMARLVHVPDGTNGRRISLVAAEVYATSESHEIGSAPYRRWSVFKSKELRFIIIEDVESGELYAFLEIEHERPNHPYSDGYVSYEPRDDDGEDKFIRLIKWKGVKEAALEFAALFDESAALIEKDIK